MGHYFRSPWIDPYLRVGAGYMYKDYVTSYSGETADGVKYWWWNVGNKDGADTRGVIPIQAGVLMADTTNRYLLSGLTDSHGSERYNRRLSERRANAIRDALVERGVPATMLKTRGHGKRIANLPVSAAEHARMGDRKVTIEPIANDDYWNGL